MTDLYCLLTATLTVDVVLKDNSANDTPSDDISDLASGQQTSSTAPPKIAATINIHSSCGVHQDVETLVVKVAQVCFWTLSSNNSIHLMCHAAVGHSFSAIRGSDTSNNPNVAGVP